VYVEQAEIVRLQAAHRARAAARIALWR
jgi:hypothetical protein